MTKPKYRYEISVFRPSGRPDYETDFSELRQALLGEQVSWIDNRMNVGYTTTDVIRLVQQYLAGEVKVKFVDENRKPTTIRLSNGKIKN